MIIFGFPTHDFCMVTKSSIGTYWSTYGKVSSRWPALRTKTLIKNIFCLTLNAPVSVVTLTCRSVAGWPPKVFTFFFEYCFLFSFSFFHFLFSSLFIFCYYILFSLLLLQLHVPSLLQAMRRPEPLHAVQVAMLRDALNYGIIFFKYHGS
jgi:hypothetical protein